jgi:hypothetical protein
MYVQELSTHGNKTISHIIYNQASKMEDRKRNLGFILKENVYFKND